jgi:APA family basic amino acid/polyamine antiporter
MLLSRAISEVLTMTAALSCGELASMMPHAGGQYLRESFSPMLGLLYGWTLFFKRTGDLNRAGVPGVALIVQGIWAAFLILPRAFDPLTGKYGNLYSNLLDYVVSAVLIFYILTIGGIFRLRRTRPLAERPYKTLGYSAVPALYMFGATAILVVLLGYRTSTTLPGVAIIATGLPVYVLM